LPDTSYNARAGFLLWLGGKPWLADALAATLPKGTLLKYQLFSTTLSSFP
jgi:hypothetical protein